MTGKHNVQTFFHLSDESEGVCLFVVSLAVRILAISVFECTFQAAHVLHLFAFKDPCKFTPLLKLRSFSV
jgi:hypothetical protein